MQLLSRDTTPRPGPVSARRPIITGDEGRKGFPECNAGELLIPLRGESGSIEVPAALPIRLRDERGVQADNDLRNSDYASTSSQNVLKGSLKAAIDTSRG